MKRDKGLFLIILVVCFIAVYAYPILFRNASPEPVLKTKVRNEPSPTTLNYTSIEAKGFAKWINQPIEKFNKVYGKPTKRFASGFSFWINTYSFGKYTNIEVTDENGKITSVKLLTLEGFGIEPFFPEMTMEELASQNIIFPNFKLQYQKKVIGFELTEDDMNYRPLIAFDNNSFAILLFSQNEIESNLSSIIYLSKEMLLKQLPYELVDGELPVFNKEKRLDWKEINQDKEDLALNHFQYLRAKDGLPAFEYNTNLQKLTNVTLNEIIENSEDHLTTQRYQVLNKIRKLENNDRFIFSNSELENFLPLKSTQSFHGRFEYPMYDLTYTLLLWYSQPYTYSRIVHSEFEQISVAISQENMLVLFQDKDEETKDSDSR